MLLSLRILLVNLSIKWINIGVTIMKSITYQVKLVLLAIIAYFVLSIASYAEEGPLLQIKSVISNLKTFVNVNTGVMSDSQIDSELRDKVKPLFDFDEMAKRSLGMSWNDISEDQRKEFVNLFSALLSRTYLAKIREGLRDSEISFGEERVKGNVAIVDTTALHKGSKIQLSYRAYKKNNSWLVYDVVIENVGIVSNYRDEFSSMMRKGGFVSIMEQLRMKDADQKARS